MVIDFTKVDSREQPPLILIDAMGNYAGVINNVKELKLTARYNEISQIEFSVPEYVDGERTNLFDDIIGLSVVELKGIGRFVLVNPKDTMDGTSTTKSCSGYSLEYELTYKKITLENDTYNLYGSYWNGDSEGTSILKLIKKMVPSWSIGVVDSDLYYKYRTFEVSNENIYNFLKGTVQEAYNCIFDFDTFNRTINVRSAKCNVPARQVYLSNKNLAKEITVEEDTENIVTRLDVNGADGVDIRDVSPDGTNTIVNLDYYMETLNFDEEVKGRYDIWKETYTSNQLNYYNLSVEHALRVMERSTETAKLGKLNGELLALESELAVKLQGGEGTDGDGTDTVLGSIEAKKEQIRAQQSTIDSISNNINVLLNSMKSINSTCSFEKAFTENGGSEAYLRAVDHYIKEDSITESSFATVEKDFVSSSAESNSFSGTKCVRFDNINDGRIRRCNSNSDSNSDNNSDNNNIRWVYSVSGGCLEIPISINGGSGIKADIISASIETIETPQSYLSIILTASLGNGIIQNNGSNNIPFSNACITITASYNGVDLRGGYFSNSDGLYLFNGSTIDFEVCDGFMCFTMDTNEYQQRSVSWDLFEYGQDILEKISQPSFSFSVTAANFFSIDEFEKFKNNIKLGDKIYLEVYEGKVLNPILIGVTISYDDYSSLELEFGDKYISSDSAFQLADLLEKSVSMGKNVDVSRFTYSAFVDSGAKTAVGEFMKNALDVSKNAILSTKDQAFVIDDAGFRLRKWKEGTNKTEYDDKQIWMSNNCIMMTDDGWDSAKMVFGEISYQEDDEETQSTYGIIASRIIGKLIAGERLIIESGKKDGSGNAYFLVDGDGATLTNCNISVANNNSRIVINPDEGISINKMKSIGATTTETKVFYADNNGNINITSNITSASAIFKPEIVTNGSYYTTIENGQLKIGIYNNNNPTIIGQYDIGKSESNEITSKDVPHVGIVAMPDSAGIVFAVKGQNIGSDTVMAIRNRRGKGVSTANWINEECDIFMNCSVDIYKKLIVGENLIVEGTPKVSSIIEYDLTVTGGLTVNGNITTTGSITGNVSGNATTAGTAGCANSLKDDIDIKVNTITVNKINGHSISEFLSSGSTTVTMPPTYTGAVTGSINCGGTFTGSCTGIIDMSYSSSYFSIKCSANKDSTTYSVQRPLKIYHDDNNYVCIGFFRSNPCIGFCLNNRHYYLYPANIDGRAALVFHNGDLTVEDRISYINL